MQIDYLVIAACVFLSVGVTLIHFRPCKLEYFIGVAGVAVSTFALLSELIHQGRDTMIALSFIVVAFQIVCLVVQVYFIVDARRIRNAYWKRLEEENKKP